MLRLSLCVCAAAMLTISGPAIADTVVAKQGAAHHSEAWSSQSKPKRKKKVVVYPDAPRTVIYGWHGWRPADPSFDRDGRPYRNPFPGQCMVDLGYGRWESCDQVGGR